MSYIVLRGPWYNIIVGNVCAPSEEKSDDSKDRFDEELERVFRHFSKYHMKILLGDFNAKVGREIFSDCQLGMRVYIRIVMSHVRVENFATSKNLVIKGTMFPHRNIHKYTWTSPDGKTRRLITY
jgi:hypothetical protein